VRRTLLGWVRGAGAADAATAPPFIRNKIAQLVVFVIQVGALDSDFRVCCGALLMS